MSRFDAIFHVLKIYLFTLFETQKYRKEDRDIFCQLIHSSYRTTMVGTGPGWSWVPGILPSLPCGWQGLNIWPILHCFPRFISGRVETWTCILIGYCHASTSLSCNATTPSPVWCPYWVELPLLCCLPHTQNEENTAIYKTEGVPLGEPRDLSTWILNYLVSGTVKSMCYCTRVLQIVCRKWISKAKLKQTFNIVVRILTLLQTLSSVPSPSSWL